jgi:hypothetical protein
MNNRRSRKFKIKKRTNKEGSMMKKLNSMTEYSKIGYRKALIS